MKRVSFINAFSGVAQVFVNMGLVLVTIPVFIRVLGLPTYSIYALVTAIGGVASLTNFGFNASLIKYLTEQKDRQVSNYDIVVTMIIITGSALLVSLLLLILSDFVLFKVLNLSSDLVTPSVRLLYGACVGASVFQICGQIPSAVLDSQQRVYLTNTVQLVFGVISKGLIIASLLIKPDLSVIAWIVLLSSFFGTCMLGWFARRVWGNMECPSLRAMFFPVAKKHFTYGRGIYAGVLMGFIYEPITKVLISRYVGLIEVGYFDIAFRIKGLLWSLFERLLYPVLPLIASKQRLSEVRDIVEEMEQKIFVLVVPAAIATLFLAGPVVRVWFGNDLLPVVVSIVCIVVCYLMALLFVPLYYFLMVKDHPNKTFILQSVNVGVNILLFAGLVPLFGYYGALTAFCLAVCASALLCVWFQWTILESKLTSSKEFRFKLLMLATALLAVNCVTAIFFMDPLTRLFMLLLFNGIATTMLFRWLKLITRNDIERYLGRESRFGIMVERLLVQGT